MTAVAKAATGRNHLFDGLRGVAAILVVAYHIGARLHREPVAGGYLAVDFFFILSGFVLARAYDARLAAGLAPLRFVEMRIVRLYPLFAVGLLLGLIAALAKIAVAAHPALTLPHVARDFGIEALMLPSPFGMELFNLNSPAWSLLCELLINIAYAFILYRLDRRLLVVLASIGAVAMVAGALTVGDLNLGWRWQSAAFGPARVTFGFITGMLIARSRASRRVTPLAFAAAAVLVVALVVPVTAGARPWLDLAFALVVAPLLIRFGAAHEVPAAAHAWFAWLGDISYPLYAIHLPIVIIATNFGVTHHLPYFAVFTATMAGTLVAAILAERLIDRPVRRWLTARLALRRSAPAQVR